MRGDHAQNGDLCNRQIEEDDATRQYPPPERYVACEHQQTRCQRP